jgi:hypothetical protein
MYIDSDAILKLVGRAGSVLRGVEPEVGLEPTT